MGIRRRSSRDFQSSALVYTRNSFPTCIPMPKNRSRRACLSFVPSCCSIRMMHGPIRINHTYYFGNEFLVAPVIEPTKQGQTTRRDVFLPAGQDWIDFWNNDRHAGGQIVTWTEKDQLRFPLFVREGAIVPMLLDVPDTLCDANYVNNPAINAPTEGLQFLVYPRGSSSFTRP